MKQLASTMSSLDKTAGSDCKDCGLLLTLPLSPSVDKRKLELCGACRCVRESPHQTPCGQSYCKLCGYPTQHGAETCSVCTAVQSSFIQRGQTVAPCQCELCSRNYSSPPPESNSIFRQSLEPAAPRTNKEGNGQGGGLKESLVDEELRNKWEREQQSLKGRQVMTDSPAVEELLKAIRDKDTSRTYYIAGVDISFIKDNNVDACAALIVVSFPDLEVVYQRLEMIQLTAPYIPGFLAFREVEPLINLYNALVTKAPQYTPDVIMVDGNGRLHPRGFGLACHLGVMLDVPCVGVAKTLIHVEGIEDNAEHKVKKLGLKKEGDTFSLITNSGDTMGMALRATKAASNPVYVSLGHKISLASAVTLVQHCSKYRVPEPTRLADLHSRQYLQDKKQQIEEFIAIRDNCIVDDCGDWS